ncbi:MAG: hypothetical protein NTW96_13790 [Planctomycetia bacterium]|nr:hypothetical protein [Planctomycetia bacterium]
MLLDQQVELLMLSLNTVHFHLLGRFSDSRVLPRVGRAKRHAHFCLRDQGHEGRLWGHGSHIVAITSRRHQLKVFHYIADHKEHGAWLWTFREGAYWPTTINRR